MRGHGSTFSLRARDLRELGAVGNTTKAMTKDMIIPSLLPILIPVIVGFGMNWLLAEIPDSFVALGSHFAGLFFVLPRKEVGVRANLRPGACAAT